MIGLLVWDNCLHQGIPLSMITVANRDVLSATITLSFEVLHGFIAETQKASTLTFDHLDSWTIAYASRAYNRQQSERHREFLGYLVALALS